MSNARPKLPVQQLVILAIFRFAEPIALTSIYPYVPEMIRSFGVPTKKVPFWAGLTISITPICQSLSAVFWGVMSDRFGRKPTILLGLFITMLTFLIWGFATNLPMAITVRAMLGFGNGNVGILRTMVAEIVPWRELQPTAFAVMPLMWCLGSVFGPAFGGFLAKPAERFPSLFGNSALLNKYPYALPNLVASVLFFISWVIGYLFIKETLETKRHQRDQGLELGKKLTALFRRFVSCGQPPSHYRARQHKDDDEEASAPLLGASRHKDATDAQAQAVAKLPPPSMMEVFTPQTRLNILYYFLVALHSTGLDAVLIVFLNFPRENRDSPEDMRLPFKFNFGFGLDSATIGTILVFQGILSSLVQFLLYPRLCARFGVLKCLRVSTTMYPVVFLITPFTALISSDTIRYAALAGVMTIKVFCQVVTFPCITIIMTNAAPSLRILGALNGFATMFAGIGRAAGPASAGAVFTWGVSRGYILVPWAYLLFWGVLAIIPTWYLVEGEGPYGDTAAVVSESGDGDDDNEEHTLIPNSPEDRGDALDGEDNDSTKQQTLQEFLADHTAPPDRTTDSSGITGSPRRA